LQIIIPKILLFAQHRYLARGGERRWRGRCERVRRHQGSSRGRGLVTYNAPPPVGAVQHVRQRWPTARGGHDAGSGADLGHRRVARQEAKKEGIVGRHRLAGRRADMRLGVNHLGGGLGWRRHGALGSGSSRRSPWSRLSVSAPPAAGSGHRPSGRPSRVAAPWPRATVRRGREPPCATFAGSRATGPMATAQAGGRGCSKPRGDEIGRKGRERIESGGENKRLY
jgi:hypothetical protein